ncbi:hypothetical protein WR25_11063 [Diploscapter pachys]|uniref:Serine-threonine/tyrosine-protein kinase catalytic domain-containing protein n=1 Tax=Diploscapter pachys TaxID=2018661 RepID=A0A2A2KJV9_9BILA|nr:hypothetical protein WR25_11063 [Diploscapter pachys]
MAPDNYFHIETKPKKAHILRAIRKVFREKGNKELQPDHVELLVDIIDQLTHDDLPPRKPQIFSKDTNDIPTKPDSPNSPNIIPETKPKSSSGSLIAEMPEKRNPNQTDPTPGKDKELMTKCWDKNPEKRPSFDQIYTLLKNSKLAIKLKAHLMERMLKWRIDRACQESRHLPLLLTSCIVSQLICSPKSSIIRCLNHRILNKNYFSEDEYLRKNDSKAGDDVAQSETQSVTPTPIDLLLGTGDVSDAGSSPAVVAINGILQACLQMLNEASGGASTREEFLGSLRKKMDIGVYAALDQGVCDCVAGSDVRLPPRGASWMSCKG